MDTDQPSAVVKDLYKSFKLPHEQHNGIKQLLLNFTKRKKGYEVQHVLEDVSFEIKKGEFFGIVGRNGSGKSTLLKLLAGIYAPDKGLVQVNGSMTPFIELGVGFNPELTGRENIYLNGALLGFSRDEMNAMYEDIVKFAELEKFMDQKLKNYSSGMQVRLAFSIAIQANSDVLILDEVLAVGDEAFQRKCVSVFEKYKARKQTIILVTHDMAVVERFCTRALMLEKGKVVDIGSPRKVAKRYSDSNKSDYIEGTEEVHSDNIIIETLDPETQQKKRQFISGDKMLVRLKWGRGDVSNAGVALIKQSGEYIFGPNTITDKYTLPKSSKQLDYVVELNVGAGEYYLKAGLFGNTAKDVLEFVDNGPIILVEPVKGDSWGGLSRLKYEWRS